MTATESTAATDSPPSPWHTLTPEEALGRLGTDATQGLSGAEASRRLAVDGPNAMPKAAGPGFWAIAAAQWKDPMSVLLSLVAIVSFIFGQDGTGFLVAILVLGNVVMGTVQERKAQAAVDALQGEHAPTARVIRDGQLVEMSAADLVAGDVVTVEAGDVVPADARIITSASLEAAESALTGESTPVDKDAGVLTDPATALGDRSCLLFQSTLITRGSATAVVVATAGRTEIGQIAEMLDTVDRVPSPLQVELRRLTIRLSIVCLAAVAYIVAVNLTRGMSTDEVVLVAITTAIASIPSGLPTFLTAMLSYGSQRLAKANAVVRDLRDVETLGSVSAINSDKTGTLTLDKMTATSMFTSGRWFSITGTGYDTNGQILGAAGTKAPDFTALGYGLTLCSDATVNSDGEVVGDPTEAALVVLAAKAGVDAGVSRREYPRAALVPFDSAYKFMATYHVAPLADGEPDSLLGLVKGAPDVVLDRCSHAYWDDELVEIEGVRERLFDANNELAQQGLRVMAFAVRVLPVDSVESVAADPMAAVDQLIFVALVGIIDPLRPAAKHAISGALDAGIEVRMITGDHTVTAGAIAHDLGLGPGVITGPEFARLTDDELREQLPNLHVFGRVAPQDKLRLVQVMQESGEVVAMTGDAVNDAAALKQADIGVAMGSGSEVSKQAAKMVLTDNNFATLLHAIELGRDIYDKISSQIRYVMIGLFSVLLLMLLASTFSLNDGQALAPIQLLFVTFFIGLFPAVAISLDTPAPGLMSQPPRDTDVTILNRVTLVRWLFFGAVGAVAALFVYVLGTFESITWSQQTQQTMVFAVMAISTVLVAFAIRRDLAPAWHGPHVRYFVWMVPPALVTWAAVEAEGLHDALGMTTLTGQQWLIAAGLALVSPVVMEITKAIRRARAR